MTAFRTTRDRTDSLGSPRSELPAADMRSMSDAELVAGVAAGHPEALEEIVARHGSVLSAVASRAIGESGFDVVQDVFARLWQSPTRFDPARGPLRSFLILQVRGRAIDVLRTDSSRRAREERDELSARRTSSPESLALDVLYSHETLGTLLDNLAPEERQPITLAFFDGYTYREVAAMLGVPEGTVKSRIRAGLQRLRAGLTNDLRPQPHRLIRPASSGAAGATAAPVRAAQTAPSPRRL